MQTETESLRPLHERAKNGDLKAGKELIHACRRGMIKPSWESPPKLGRGQIELHLQRRGKPMSGRAMK